MSQFLHAIFCCAFVTLLISLPTSLQGQCTNPSLTLPDTSVPVDGATSTAYCLTLTFDPAMTGLPSALTMDLEHTWEGDLSIFVAACGNTLNVMQRPGATGNCAGGSPFGSTTDIGSPGSPATLIFSDSGVTDPEGGVGPAGGTFALTSDDGCGVGSPGITSFATLWAACPPGPISAEICVADHAFGDGGNLSNLSFIFPNPVICGCTDPMALNYDPSANVDDGSCVDPCPNFSVTTSNPNVSVCEGQSVMISGTANNASNPIYSWSATGGATAWLDDTSSPNPTVTVPMGATGSETFTLTVTENTCSETVDVVLSIDAAPTPSINGLAFICPGQTSTLTVNGGPYSTYTWSNSTGGPSISVGAGTYSVTVTNTDMCEGIASFTVQEHPAVTPTIVGPASFCQGGTATLSLDQSYNSYSWSTTETSPTIDVDQTNTYSVTVTDGNGCQGTASFFVEELGDLQFSITGDDFFCEGGASALDAPAGYAMYTWSNNEMTAGIVVDDSGTYSVTVEDANGCEGSASIDVTEGPLPQPVITGEAVVCDQGSIDLMVTETFDQYVWSTTETDQSISVSSANTYSVTVTDAEGCMGETSFDVSAAPPINISITGDLAYCPEAGSTMLSVAPGTYDTYDWSNSMSTPSIATNGAGAYSVTVTDSDGCQGEATVDVTEYDSPMPTIDGTAAVCDGESTSLNVTESFSSYEWSTSAMSQSITVDQTGTYTVTVTDGNMCEAETSFDFTVNDLPSPSITGPAEFCAGDMIELTAVGDFESVQWNSGPTDPTITVFTAGDYTVLVTDENDCTNTASITVSENPLPTVDISGDMNICDNGDGVLDATAGFASYQWSTNADASSITVDQPGTYSVTVEDANMCMNEASFDVGLFPNPVPEILGELTLCPFSSTDLFVGETYQSYQWSTTDMGSLITVDFPGTYGVTVTDDNGCQGETSASVEAVSAPTPSITGDFEICEGETTTLDAGAGYQSYYWSTFDEDQTIVVGGGIVWVTVTDDNGCEGEDSYEVTEYAMPFPFILGDDVVCVGGSATLEAEGGYDEYLWSTNEDDETIEVTQPGTYEVTVTTDIGCEGTASITLDEQVGDPIEITGSTSLCPGQSTTLSIDGNFDAVLWSTGSSQLTTQVSNEGPVEVTVTYANGCTSTDMVTVAVADDVDLAFTGATEYCAGSSTEIGLAGNFETYLWSTTASTPTIDVTSPGTYSVTATLAGGCSGEASITVFENSLPSAEINGEPSFCPGGNTLLSAPAGLTDYQWSNNEETANITVDVAGSYALTVMDAYGCMNSSTVEVVETAPLEPTILGDVVLCPDESTELSVDAAYAEYLWSDNTDGATINTNLAGTYGVTITDNDGCTGEATIEIASVNAPAISIAGDLTFCAGTQTILIGPAGMAAYEWSNNIDTEEIEVSESGTYSLLITDENGCQNQAAVEVAENPVLMPAITGDLEICPGESTLLGVEDNYLEYTWTGNFDQATLSVSEAGEYSVVVEDDQGCTGEATVEVLVFPDPTPSINGDLSLCFDQTETLSVPESFTSYTWNDGTNGAALQIETAGTFSVQVTDDNGCVGTASVDVSEDPELTVAITGDDSFCFGGVTNLSVPANFTSYSWSTSDDSPSVVVTNSALVGVTVEDDNGCSATAELEVTEFNLPEVSIDGSLSFCPGGATTLSATAGYVDYLWSDNSPDPTIDATTAGEFSVTVTDDNNCQNNTSVNVEEQSELSPMISGELSFCANESTSLNVAGDFSTYVWSDDSQEEALVVTEAGTYGVTVEDAFGCAGTASVEVTMVPLPEPQITGSLSYCSGDTTLLNAGGGFAAYLWSGGAAEQLLQAASPGQYAVTVTDADGCSGSTSVEVVQNELPTPSILGIPGFCPGESTQLNGEEGYDSYVWSTGSSSPLIEVAAEGPVNLLVTDDNGCEGVASVDVAVFAVEVPAIAGAAQYCPGTSTILTAESGFETYTWSNGSQETSLEVDAPSLVELVVSDLNGCLTNASVDVSEFVVVAPTLDAPEGFCAGETALIEANDDYSIYSWSVPGDQANLSIDVGGVYELTVTDVNGCLSNAAVAVEEYALPQPAIGGSLSFCVGNSTTINAGANYASYLWSDGTDGFELEVSQSGLYALTVTDENGCIGATSSDVSEATELSPVISGELAYCEGTTTVLYAGAGFATYSWTGGSQADSLVVDQPGTYALQVQDAGGCAGTAQVAVVENALPSPTILGSTNFCSGADTELSLEQSYVSQLWNTGAPTVQINPDEGGIYSVVVQDVNGCSGNAQVEVVELDLPVFEINGATEFCAGAETSLSIAPAFADYSWSTGDDQQTISSDLSGTIGVTVTDGEGCAEEAVVQLTEIPLPLADAGAGLVLNCDIQEVALGGSGTSAGPEFDYSWTGPAFALGESVDPNPVVDSAGVYTLVVTNNIYNCQSEAAEVVIEDQTNEPAVVLAVLDILDCTTSTVVVDGTSSEAGPSITYQWYDENFQTIGGATDPTYNAQIATMFYLEVQDTVTGCENIAGVEVEEDIAYPVAQAGPGFTLDCAVTEATLDGSDSQEGATINYFWYTDIGQIETGQQTQMPLVHEPGWYFLLVSDSANGCENMDSVLVNQNVAYPSVSAGEDVELDCHTTNAALQANATANSNSIGLQWYHNGDELAGATTTDLTVEDGGTYTLVVTDLTNLCTSEDELLVVVDEAMPTGLEILADNPTCFGDSDGSILITGVDGGTAPFLYSIDGLAFSDNTAYNDLVAGAYEVSVEDANGCLYTLLASIDNGNDLSVDLGPDIRIQEGELVDVIGDVTVDPSDIVRVNWNTQAEIPCEDCLALEQLQLSVSTQFFLTVEDVNGCVSEDELTVFVEKDRPVFVPTAFSPDGDGNNDIFFINAGPEVVKINSFLVYNRWGEAVFEVYNTQPNEPDWGWDGTYRGLLVNSAVYVWFAELEFDNGDRIIVKGDVAVMR